VRSKNTLNTFMMCVAALAVATVTWAVIGYSLAFAPGNGFIGGLDYVALYNSIKAMGDDLHVVGNPGIPFEQVEALIPATDTLVIFEGPLQNADPNGASFREYPDRGPYAGLPLWFTRYDRSRLANLGFGVPDPLDMIFGLFKAVGYNAGYVYLTDDQLPNPYDTLPSYWEQEVAWIELLNWFL